MVANSKMTHEESQRHLEIANDQVRSAGKGGGWWSWKFENEVHVIPDTDVIQHKLKDCVCGPSSKKNGNRVIVQHNLLGSVQ